MADRREPHPTIPHLYRKLGPPTTGELLYPYLPKQSEVVSPPPPRQVPTKGLLSDVERGHVSSLGGVAAKGGR